MNNVKSICVKSHKDSWKVGLNIFYVNNEHGLDMTKLQNCPLQKEC